MLVISSARHWFPAVQSNLQVFFPLGWLFRQEESLGKMLRFAQLVFFSHVGYRLYSKPDKMHLLSFTCIVLPPTK